MSRQLSSAGAHLANYGTSVKAAVPELLPGDGDLKEPIVFTHAFTVALLLGFLAPVIISVHLGMDPDVTFWIGRYGLMALFLPVLFIASYVIQVMDRLHGKPKKSTLYFTLIITSASLMITGGAYMSKSRYLYGQLKSEDCSGGGDMGDKLFLQQAYLKAHKLYDDCSTRLTKENGNMPLMRRPTLQNCEEWVNMTTESRQGVFGFVASIFDKEPLSKHIKSTREMIRLYKYLASAEANQICGGFCSSGPMLWSAVEGDGGACSPMIGLKFLTVEHQATLLFGSSALSGFVGYLGLLRADSHLKKLGYH